MKVRHCSALGREAQEAHAAMLRAGTRSLVGLAVLLILAGMAVTEQALAANPGEELGKSRFTLVLDGAAARDNKTGLVWEQSPDRVFDVWSASIERCKTKEVGGRKGWRAPTIDELKSLVDSDQKDPALPEGHPFSNIKSHVFWAVTPSPTDDIVAWQVSFFTGVAGTDQKSLGRRVWCVLGK